METERPLNRRQDDRYLIDEIPLEGIGTLVEISKNGLKIKKASGFVTEDPTITFALSGQDIITEVRWQDKTFLGLRTAVAFNAPAFFTQRIKRAKEILAPAQRIINLENAVAQYKKEEGLISMINLCMEVHSPDPVIRKIGWYINEISSLQEKEKSSGIKGGEEGDEGEGQDKSGKEGKSIKEELIAQGDRFAGARRERRDRH